MTAPNFTILTQKELTIDLSRPAMANILMCMKEGRRVGIGGEAQVECEMDNFRNTLQNLMERSEPASENFDLIGG